MKTIAVLILSIAMAMSLAGCGTLELSNRPMRTLACDKVYITSLWQVFGIAVEMDKRDAAVILKDCKPPAL